MYKLLEKEVTVEGVTATTYGIGCDTVRFEDVCTDESAMTQLVAKCNELELSPVHLADVVEDFLNR